MEVFNKSSLSSLYKPKSDSAGEENGQVTIIGGSKLFHGAPLLSLKVASRVVDMVFFATPEKSVGYVAEQIKSKLLSFIWVPWEEVDAYVEKSDACLIGPGFMRYRKESEKLKAKSQKLDEEGERTREITKRFLKKFPSKKWVIDAGSLQVMDADWIPENAIITPNRKEFEMLFGDELRKLANTEGSEKSTEVVEDKNNPDGGRTDSSEVEIVGKMAEKYKCVIVFKGPETIVCQPAQAGSPERCIKVLGGNAGLTKGGSGDVLAGLTVAFLAKNEPFLAASSASYICKFAADELYKKVGPNYNAEDLANKIPEVLASLHK